MSYPTEVKPKSVIDLPGSGMYETTFTTEEIIDKITQAYRDDKICVSIECVNPSGVVLLPTEPTVACAIVSAEESLNGPGGAV